MAEEGEISHVGGHVVQIGELFLNDLFSDVTLLVEGQALKAHRAILAAKSDYFRTLLTSGMKESHSKEVELKETPIKGFRLLLRYIYTGHMSLMEQELQVVLDILGLAQKYCFTVLETSVTNHLCSILDVERVCQIFQYASMYDIKPLVESCYEFIDDHGEEVLEHPSFLKLPQNLVTDIFSRDSLGVPEVKIFKAAQKWLEGNKKDNEDKTTSSDIATQVMSKVRLELIPVNDLLSVIRPSGIVSQDTLLETIESSMKNPPQKQRENNVATEENGTKVICGKDGASLLNKATASYASHINIDKKFLPSLVANAASSCNFCEHHMGKSGIVIMLGRPFVINHIAMKLWEEEKAKKSYSYVIDVSADGVTWDRVVDYSSYPCHSLQNLFFQQRTTKFIRIIGTGDTSQEFRVVSFEALYTATPIAHDKASILVPTDDVAMSADVCNGNNVKGGMLKESGYSFHNMTEEEGIVVQLAQPYILDSIRLELDGEVDPVADEKHRFSYSVEVSIDNNNWEKICERGAPGNTESGWQNITFSSRPVVFARIKGTGTTRKECNRFFLDNFECPSSVASDGKGKSA